MSWVPIRFQPNADQLERTYSLSKYHTQMKEIVLLCILGLFSVYGMDVYSPSNIAGNYKSYGIFWGNGPKNFNVTGQVVLADPSHGCSKLKNADGVSGKIVLFDKGKSKH